jgi:hypothetical protein
LVASRGLLGRSRLAPVSESATEAIAARLRDHLERMRYARAALDERMPRYEAALEALTGKPYVEEPVPLPRSVRSRTGPG